MHDNIVMPHAHESKANHNSEVESNLVKSLYNRTEMLMCTWFWLHFWPAKKTEVRCQILNDIRRIYNDAICTYLKLLTTFEHL